MKTIRNYVRVNSLEEAYELNQKKANRIIGGMLWLRLGSGTIQTAIDLSNLGLNEIQEESDCFTIGAMTTLRQLELNTELNQCFDGAIKKAVQDIVGVQFRNMATVGGSIWGRFGFSDVLSVFLALDTQVELYPKEIIPLGEFLNRKNQNEILVRLIVKKNCSHISYQAVRGQRTDFPTLTCAVSLIDSKVRAVVGARPAKAKCVLDNKGILSQGINEESAKSFAQYVAKQVSTGSNIRGSAEYRTHLAQVLCERGVLEIGETK